MNLILFGFKGCGKTHFGKRLSQRMNRPFIELDNVISELYADETNERIKPPDILKKIKEEAFHLLEKRAIEMLSGHQNSIIAVNDSAIWDPENVGKLRKIGELVYLEASPMTLRRRQFRDEIADFLKDENGFETLIKTRLPIYESIRSRRIDIDLLDEAAVIAALRMIVILEDPDRV